MLLSSCVLEKVFYAKIVFLSTQGRAILKRKRKEDADVIFMLSQM